MALNNDHARAETCARIAENGRDLMYNCAGDPTNKLEELCSGPGPALSQPLPSIVDWMLNPHTVTRFAVHCLAVVSYLVQCTTPAGKLARLESGGCVDESFYRCWASGHPKAIPQLNSHSKSMPWVDRMRADAARDSLRSNENPSVALVVTTTVLWSQTLV